MKPITSFSKRFCISFSLLTALAVLPLGSTFHSAQAKPKDNAPAYGYRAKTSKAQKRQNKRTRRQNKREARRDRRDDYRDDRRDNPNDRDDDYRNDRNGDYPYSNYRNRRGSTEDRIRNILGL